MQTVNLSSSKTRMLALSVAKPDRCGYMVLIFGLFVTPLDKLTLMPATSDWIQQAEFALEIKKKVLPLYEQMFDIEYPLPKLDTLIVSYYLLEDD